MLVPEGLFSIVALVLAIGGLFKLSDPDPTRRMLEVVGLPGSDVATHVIGGVEIAVGLAAFLFAGPVLAAAVAALYLGFAVLMAMLVRKGDEAASCGCFGRLSTRPSIVHVAADVLASIIAAASAAARVDGFLDYRGVLAAGGLAQMCFVAVGTLLLVLAMTALPAKLDASRRARHGSAARPGTFRTGGSRAVRTEVGPAAADARSFDVEGTAPSGEPLSVTVLGTRHATLLVFLSGTCVTCARFWSAFARGEADGLIDGGTRLVIVTKGPTSERRETVRLKAPAGITTVMSDSAFADYGVVGSPYFVLVDGVTGRVVGEGTADTWAQVAELLA